MIENVCVLYNMLKFLTDLAWKFYQIEEKRICQIRNRENAKIWGCVPTLAVPGQILQPYRPYRGWGGTEKVTKIQKKRNVTNPKLDIQAPVPKRQLKEVEYFFGCRQSKTNLNRKMWKL